MGSTRRTVLRSVAGAGGIAAAATLASSPSASADAGTGTGWYDVTQPPYNAVADGTADASPAINAALTEAKKYGGGVVYLPAGTYFLGSPLAGTAGVRLTGASAAVSVLTSTTSPVLDFGGSFISGMEVDHLGLTSTGAHLMIGARLKALYLHDCRLTQTSANHAIFFADQDADEDHRALLMLECVFERNLETVTGAPRTTAAWSINCAATYGAVNVNTWRDNVCTNGVTTTDAQGNSVLTADDTQYWFKVAASGASASGVPAANEANTWDNITFEHPLGGMILLQSASRSRIQDCVAWDAYDGIANSLVVLQPYSSTAAGTTAYGAPCSDTLISGGLTAAWDYPHAKAPAAPAYDLSLDASTVHTTILHPSKKQQINLGASSGVTIVGGPADLQITGASSASTAVSLAGAGGPASGPVATGSNDRSGLVTFGTGAAPTTGGQVQVTFGTPFPLAPTVMITPANGPTAGLLCAVESVSATGFSLFAGSAPAANQANTHYGFYWQASI